MVYCSLQSFKAFLLKKATKNKQKNLNFVVFEKHNTFLLIEKKITDSQSKDKGIRRQLFV
jgi:predicted GNAT superfamily acetyltransferase